MREENNGETHTYGSEVGDVSYFMIRLEDKTGLTKDWLTVVEARSLMENTVGKKLIECYMNQSWITLVVFYKLFSGVFSEGINPC
jgi:hypothetical protein